MNYEYGYAICALAFLSVVEVHFFRQKRYPSLQNKIYAFVMILALGDLILDILGAYTITHALDLPQWTNYIVNTPFYIIQVILPAVVMVYFLSIAGFASTENSLKIKMALVPATGGVLLIVTNVYSGLIFYVDPVMGYTRGSLFNVLYVITIFYFLANFFILFFFRKKFTELEFATIFLFLAICSLGISIQYAFPSYLLTSMVIALSLTMMFFAMQMPEDMLDVMTGAFNYAALLRYIDSVTKRNRKIVGFAVSLDAFFNNENLTFPLVNEISKAMVSHLSVISCGSWVFRLKGNIYIVLTEDEKAYQKAIKSLNDSTKLKLIIEKSEITIPFNVCTFEDSSLVASSSNFTRLVEITFEKAKAQGDSGIINLNAKAKDAFNRYVQIETGLSEALETDRLYLNYQPIYSVREKCFISAEALLRFNHPLLGKISPKEFIPIAEKNGTIIEIDFYVLKKVCQFIKKVDPIKKFALDMISVNFSTLDLIQEDFYGKITETIKGEGVPFTSLGLEITESMATKFTDEIIEELKALKYEGLRILLDDFGSGYSNIQKMARLPLYAVKIDQSLFSSFIQGSQGAIVFEDMVKMCNRLQFLTIVEGVDSKKGAESLMDMDVDRIQGFYYSLPLSENDFIEKLSKG